MCQARASSSDHGNHSCLVLGHACPLMWASLKLVVVGQRDIVHV